MDERKEISDDELLRLAGKACFKVSEEPHFDADDAWKSFLRKHQRRNLYIKWASAAAVLLLVLMSVFAIMKYNPRPVTLFTAMKDIPQIILIGEDDFSQVITSTELDLTSHLYSQQRTYTIMTPVGKSLKVILPDSSLVWMNAQSRVDYSRTDCREISLDGEAYFQVKRDETSPFIVKFGEIKAKVLGTSFNIRGYSKEQMHITLLTGSLALESDDDMSRIMEQGEDLTLQQGDFLIRKIDEVTEPLWTTGYFAFDNVPLYDLLCELGRWYNINVVALDKDVVQRRIHFKCSRSERIDSLVEILNSVGGFRIVHKGNTLFIQ